MTLRTFEQDAELLAGLGHPLRLRIVERLTASDDPLSPSKLAEILGEKLGTVAYHVRKLERAGAIGAVREEKVRGAVEHYYRPTNPAAKVAELLMA